MYTSNEKIPRVAWVIGGLLFVGILLFAGFNYFGPDRGTATPHKTEEVVDTTFGQWEEKDEVLEWYRQTIAILDERIGDIEKLAIESDETFKEAYYEQLVMMEEELDILKGQLNQLQQANATDWQSMQERVRQTRARVEMKLGNDFRDFAADAGAYHNHAT